MLARLRLARFWVSRTLDRIHRALPLLVTQFLWFTLPANTLGLTTWMFILYAGHRVNSASLKFWGYVYLLLAVLVSTAGWAGFPRVAAASFLTILFVGGLHSANAGRRVWYAARDELAPGVGHPAATRAPLPEPAIARAQWTVERRRQAREILQEQPALGQELRIGRPDQPRTYDDGGLVDVNHVPAEVLAAALELPRELAECIVTERSLRGGFASPEELVVYCGLSVDRLALIRDRLVFQPM